jgi:excisionase family DNA binding protein
MIASILNRNGHRNAHGERWTARGVCSLRHRQAINVYIAGEGRSRYELTLDEAAAMLSINATTVMKWIRNGRLHAEQLCPNAPWVLRESEVERFRATLAEPRSSNAANADQLNLQIQ